MIYLRNCKNIFIDFDGIIVDSNKFKEYAIRDSILQLFGESINNYSAINYFNINAGISREKKLSKFFEYDEVNQIMEKYSEKCKSFFVKALPTNGFKEFLFYIKNNTKNLRLFVLSGGEKNEIEIFLKNNNLIIFFDNILASEKSKIEHLKKFNITKNDIFIGDSKNDLKVAIESGLRFVLFEEFQSSESSPSKELIKKHVFLKTQNFQSLLHNLAYE